MADEMEEDLPLLLEEEWQTGAEFDDDEVHGQYVAFTVDGTLSMRGDNTFDQFRPTVDRPTPVRLPVAQECEVVSLGEACPRLWHTFPHAPWHLTPGGIEASAVSIVPGGPPVPGAMVCGYSHSFYRVYSMHLCSITIACCRRQ